MHIDTYTRTLPYPNTSIKARAPESETRRTQWRLSRSAAVSGLAEKK